MKPKFPDVSYYQGTIDWVKMATKTLNVTIRGCYGVTVDTQFYVNWREAKKNHIRRGVYHFAMATPTPEAQANVLCNLIRGDMPEGRIWVDWEKSTDGTYPNIQKVVTIMKKIEEFLPGTIVGLYTGYFWFVEHSSQASNPNEYAYLKERPLWLADYDSLPQIPLPWTTLPEIHQRGTPVEGHDYGVQSLEIDMDDIYKNFELYGWKSPTAIAWMETIAQGWYVVGANPLNIRNVPGGTGTATDIGDLPMNGKALCDGAMVVGTVVWLHLKDAVTSAGAPVITSNGQPVSARSDCWASGQYMKLTDDNVPAPLVPIDGVIPPDPEPEPTPPQSVTVIDDQGIAWKSTSFTRV